MIENSNYSYPVVLYPPKICSILKSYPPISEIFDDLPQPPIITINKFLIFLEIMAIIITLVGSLSLLLSSILLYIIYIVLGTIIFAIFDINNIVKIPSAHDNIFYQSKYDTSLIKTLRHLVFLLPFVPIHLIGELIEGNSYEKIYKSRYNAYKEKYYKIINEYELKIDQNPSHNIYYEIIRKYRQKNIQNLKNVLELTKEPKKMNVDPRRGYLEDYFHNYLTSFFQDKIKVNLQLKKPDFDYPYTPDFIYQDKKWNLYIDIEIDEPYVKNTKKPIHVDDSTRNEFFLESNWIIIRFAEE
jgi:hypothetical protein